MPTKKTAKKSSKKKAPAKKSGKGKSGGSEWILKPPAPDEISFRIAVGKNAKLTPKVRKALEALAKAVQAAGTADFAATKRCLPDYNCSTHTDTCTERGSCTAQVQKPCFVDYSCAVKVPVIDVNES